MSSIIELESSVKGLSITNQKVYLIKVKKTGRLLYLAEVDREGGYACNPSSFRLTPIASYNTLYQAESLAKVFWVVNNPTPWYNSSKETPHHVFKPEELTIIERRVTNTDTVLSVDTAYENILGVYLDKQYPEKRDQQAKATTEKALKNKTCRLYLGDFLELIANGDNNAEK